MTDSIFKVTCGTCNKEVKVRSSVYAKRLAKMPTPNKEYLDANYTCRDCRRNEKLTRLGNPKTDPKVVAAKTVVATAA